MHNNNTKIVFLGIDVHKKTYSVTALYGNHKKHASMPSNPEALLSFIKNHFSDHCIYSVYEAGFSGFILHRILLENGIKSIVVHAASIEVSQSKTKNDKRDSMKMATQLRDGRLKCVHMPTVQRECWRSVSRLRAQFVQERSRLSCRIKSFLYYFGLLGHDHSGKTSRKWLKSLSAFEWKVDNDVFFCIQTLIRSWFYLDDTIKLIERRLKEQSKKDFAIHSVYRGFAGIGNIAARVLSNELGDLSQFSSERELFGFTGLTPCEYSSGEKRWLGNISRQGNPIIRGMLTEIAWKAIKLNPQLEEVFDRLVRNSGSRKKAIVGIARRMIGHIRAEFKKKINFQIRT